MATAAMALFSVAAMAMRQVFLLSGILLKVENGECKFDCWAVMLVQHTLCPFHDKWRLVSDANLNLWNMQKFKQLHVVGEPVCKHRCSSHGVADAEAGKVGVTCRRRVTSSSPLRDAEEGQGMKTCRIHSRTHIARFFY